MSIEKSISPTLSNLIAEANYTIESQETTLKEKLLAVYNQATTEGFEPKEARKLMEEKIPKVTDRYIREVLPEEAKNLNMQRLPKPKPPEEENCGTVPQIPNPPTQVIQDAESEELIELPEPPHRQEQEEIVRLRHQIEELTNENTQLRIQKIGTLSNKFDFEYDFEMPSGSIVPFIVTCFPDKKDGYIRLNKEKVAAIEKKESRNKK